MSSGFATIRFSLFTLPALVRRKCRFSRQDAGGPSGPEGKKAGFGGTKTGSHTRATAPDFLQRFAR
jgi:hypothetical protein